MPQIGEFASGVQETSKLSGTRVIFLFRIGVFTLFNCGLVDYHKGIKKYSVDI
jgi:hypothetical protein